MAPPPLTQTQGTISVHVLQNKINRSNQCHMNLAGQARSHAFSIGEAVKDLTTYCLMLAKKRTETAMWMKAWHHDVHHVDRRTI